MSHLRLLAELSRQKSLTDAASAITISQPAASRLLSEIENLVETNVYTRIGRGIELTAVGQKLAYRCLRILNEISDAGDDVEQFRNGDRGEVRIGAVTGPAMEYVLPAIRQVRLSYPDISISVEVGPSSMLAPMLKDGELDFSLSRIPMGTEADVFEEKPLAREPACVVARRDHPLTRGPLPIPAVNLLAYDWVLPPPGSPIRNATENVLRAKKLPQPGRVLTTSSFLFTLATLQRTNAVGAMARSVAENFATHSDGSDCSLVILQSDFDMSVETYSFLTRKGQVLTPVAQVLAREVLRDIRQETGSVA
ncbi:MAG: LysR family transcriptional regulator [Rhodobacteraceae bacterium]|nr:LysR family transcriptional regulator [Paracoccaceae bacterium]